MSSNYSPSPVSARAEVLTRRTYNRPKPDGSFESWEETVDRVIGHQAWLWARAKANPLATHELAELDELRQLMYDRKVSLSGRTLWLGGTDVSKRREASQFNCSFLRVETVHDVVDGFWLLLQGCGVGFEPIMGTLNGWTQPVEIAVVRSSQPGPKGGREANHTELVKIKEGTFVQPVGSGKGARYLREWTLVVGDSAESWAKAVGKMMAMKERVDRVVLDFSQIRPAGGRLAGYGWISSGDETLVTAMKAIAEILNRRAGQLLTRIDILDVMNWLGTTLSSRRAAEIALMPSDDPEAYAFATAKDKFWESNPQRAQSNNSLVFHHKPTRFELEGIFRLMLASGGSEPGFINAVSAKKRAPWFKGCNPCAEILLGSRSFCNLVEVNLSKFSDEEPHKVRHAVRIAARANYRQTCVNLEDGVLQRSWHENNEFLRLCGVGLTGIVQYNKLGPVFLQGLRKVARSGADSMADDLHMPRAKAVTTIKPSGTLSKIMDTTEGVHKPLGKYIFNNVQFSKHDPLVALLKDAGYRTFDHPFDPTSTLVTFPVAYEGVEFDRREITRGKEKVAVEVNLESAVDQLERYRLLMDNYVDHNCSVTISYSPEEVPAIVDWLLENWDTYVGVSFIYRNDPTKTAADLGYQYLPQEVVTEEDYKSYTTTLKPLKLTTEVIGDGSEVDDSDCEGGVCPIR